MLFGKRLAAKIAKFGEHFAIDGVTYQGVFKLLDSGTMSMYLDDVEKMGVTHPGLVLETGPDVPIDVNDNITRDSRTYTVFKTVLHRIGDTAVAKTVILS